MANLFKGMSQSNFMDGLVAKAGKNGHELYNFLVELIDENAKKTQKIEPVVEQKPRPNVPNYFEGSKRELLDWAQMYMTEKDYEVMNKWCGSMAHGYFATQIAGRIGLTDFTWIHIARTTDDDPIKVEYYVYMNKNGNLEWSERLLTEAEMI